MWGWEDSVFLRWICLCLFPIVFAYRGDLLQWEETIIRNVAGLPPLKSCCFSYDDIRKFQPCWPLELWQHCKLMSAVYAACVRQFFFVSLALITSMYQWENLMSVDKDLTGSGYTETQSVVLLFSKVPCALLERIKYKTSGMRSRLRPWLQLGGFEQ